MNLILALFMISPLSAVAANTGSLTLKGAGAIQIGMSRAEVSEAVETMGGGKLERGEANGCSTIDTLRFTASRVYSMGRIQFDRQIGEKCDIPVRTDKAYNIQLDFAEGLDGQVVLNEHLKALGKPYKREGGPDSGVSYYEWRKMPYSVLLVINLRSGTAMRKEVRDILMDREISNMEKRRLEKSKTDTQKKIQGGL